MAGTSTNDTKTLLVGIITASAAIMATVVTQIITAYNARKSDERKIKAEIQRIDYQKRIEIGENFYHFFRESSLNLHRLKNVYENEKIIETPRGREHLEAQRKQITDKALKLVEDTRLWNLTDIYFKIESTGEVTARDVKIMNDLNFKRLELDGLYERANDEQKRNIGVQFIQVTDDIIKLIINVNGRVERDLLVVKNALIEITKVMQN